MRAIRFSVACAALLAAAFGCGLIDTSFTFATDPQSFTLDATAMGLAAGGAAKIPAIPCAVTNDICAQSTAQLSCKAQTYGCKVACKGTTCAVSATAEFAVPVDVSAQVKSNTQASMLSKVSLQRLLLRVNENTLTFRTPTIDIFVGPNGASKITDPGVVKLATIPAIDPGQKPNNNIPTTQEGTDKLGEFIKTYTVPFKMLAKVSLSFASGDPVPQGRLAFDIIAYLQVNP